MSEKSEAVKLANDLMQMTLHGPPPVATTMTIASALVESDAEVSRLTRELDEAIQDAVEARHASDMRRQMVNDVYAAACPGWEMIASDGSSGSMVANVIRFREEERSREKIKHDRLERLAAYVAPLEAEVSRLAARVAELEAGVEAVRRWAVPESGSYVIADETLAGGHAALTAALNAEAEAVADIVDESVPLYARVKIADAIRARIKNRG